MVPLVKSSVSPDFHGENGELSTALDSKRKGMGEEEYHYTLSFSKASLTGRCVRRTGARD